MLHVTTRSGNVDLLEIFLKKEEINISLVYYKYKAAYFFIGWPRYVKGDKYILENCFKLLLDKHSVTKMDIYFRDVSGNTSLHIALQSAFRNRPKLLLIEDADVSIRGNAGPVMMPTTLPILEEILEYCLMSINELFMNKDFLLKLNNELLTNIVSPIAECQHLRKLLKHPVISTLLFLKWLKFRLFFF